MSSNQVGQSVLSAHEMFFRTLEAGEIELRQIIDHGLTIFGFTRIGKTTLAHLLSHGALTAIGNSLDSLSWKPGLKN